jgi:iron-sulfur cluster assembly protein
MNAPILFSRRSLSVCFACRRNLLRQRQFSTTPASLVAAFQAYTLPSQPPPAPRNASVPDTSIAHTVEPPSLPRVHETRPPQQSGKSTNKAPASRPEAEAQTSKAEFAELSTTTQQPRQQKQTAEAATAETSSAAPTPAVKPAARPRPKLRARKAAIQLTPAAVEHLRALLDQPEPKLIKVGVRNRGCSGLAYHL